MSGGTDSSAVAAMLVDQGCEVIGLTAYARGPRCCSLEDVNEPVPFVIFGYTTLCCECTGGFAEKIVDPFVDGYAAGETPLPCIQCNAFIKFGFLLTRQTTWRHVATGHYARVEKDVAGLSFFCAKDPEKDQSYFYIG